jgi:hydrogenase-4 component E
MVNLLIIIFNITLIYMAVASRLSSYTRVLMFQGLILFGVAAAQLHHIEALNFTFIILETLIFKAFVVPYFFNKIFKNSKYTGEREKSASNFSSLFVISLCIVLSFIWAYNLHDEHLKITYFTASISAIITGVYLIVFRKKIISHIIGYMIIENGIFLLSLAIGAEMPMIVNFGILLDLFTSMLILGFFVNKIEVTFNTAEAEKLNELKD